MKAGRQGAVCSIQFLEPPMVLKRVRTPCQSWAQPWRHHQNFCQGTKRHQMQRRKHKTDCKYLETGIQKTY